MKPIYVVERDAAVRDSLDIVLRSKGFEVSTFEKGNSFLNAVDRQSQGGLLLDMKLADLKPEDILRELTGAAVQISTIVMGDGRNDALKQRTLELGAVEPFDKPLNIQLMIEFIVRLS